MRASLRNRNPPVQPMRRSGAAKARGASRRLPVAVDAQKMGISPALTDPIPRIDRQPAVSGGDRVAAQSAGSVAIDAAGDRPRIPRHLPLQ